MYYRHDLDIQYPDKCDQHMITVKHVRDVNLDTNYPYLQKSAWFKFQRFILRILQHTVFPPLVWLCRGLRIHGREKLKEHKDLFQKGLLTISNHVYMLDYVSLMVAMRPRIGYFPVWKTNLEGPNGISIRMAGGIPVPTDNIRSMVKFKQAIEEVLDKGEWVHFFPEGSMWSFYPDIRPLKKAVFKYAVALDRPILPMAYSFRPRKGLWKLLGKAPLADLTIGDPIFPDKDLPKNEAIAKMQKEAYHILQELADIHPGDPTYNENPDPETYQKTM